jgi:hypothetical protein
MSDIPTTNQKMTLAELTETYSSSLAAVIEKNGIAVVVCALTENQFETQVMFNPKHASNKVKAVEVTSRIGKVTHELLKEGLDSTPPKIVLA